MRKLIYTISLIVLLGFQTSSEAITYNDISEADYTLFLASAYEENFLSQKNLDAVRKMLADDVVYTVRYHTQKGITSQTYNGIEAVMTRLKQIVSTEVRQKVGKLIVNGNTATETDSVTGGHLMLLGITHPVKLTRTFHVGPKGKIDSIIVDIY